jgi:hypothetical protein
MVISVCVEPTRPYTVAWIFHSLKNKTKMEPLVWLRRPPQFICRVVVGVANSTKNRVKKKKTSREILKWGCTFYVCVCESTDFLNWPKGYSFSYSYSLLTCVSHSFIIQFVGLLDVVWNFFSSSSLSERRRFIIRSIQKWFDHLIRSTWEVFDRFISLYPTQTKQKI